MSTRQYGAGCARTAPHPRPRRGRHRTHPWRAATAAVLGLALLAASCRREPSPEDIAPPLQITALNGERTLAEVRDFVALGPRVAGTPGVQRAADYLAKRLRAIGLDPLVEEFTEATPAGPVVFRNVTAVVPGKREEALIVASHYDTKGGIDPGFTGANDSGSSTGLLLELARILQRSAPLPCDVIIAFFDGEECAVRYGPSDGLHGSRHLAQTLARNRLVPRTRAVILLDMIGDRDLTVTIPRNSTPELTALAFESARNLGVRDHFALARGAILDDHVPFLEAGIPAVDLIDFHYGSQPGRNDYWHTPQDTLDKLSADSLQTVGRVVLHMLNTLMLNPRQDARPQV